MGAQVILGIETTTNEKFDRVIALLKPYQLLQDDGYEEASALVELLVKQMYSNLIADTEPLDEVEATPSQNNNGVEE